MASPEVVGVISTIIAGTTTFLGAGAKFLSEIKSLKAAITADVLEVLRRDHIAPQAIRMEALEKRHDANVKGWGLEIESLRSEMEEAAESRGHGHQSVADYHSSEELVQRLEVLERSLKVLQRSAMTRKTFESFVEDQHTKALDVARLLGQIEGELNARFTPNQGK